MKYKVMYTAGAKEDLRNNFRVDHIGDRHH